MSTVRISLLLIIVCLSCAKIDTKKVSSNIKTCIQKRGAIDIGSGTSKLVVAVVNICKGQINNLIFEAQRSLALKEDLENSKDNTISLNMQQKAAKTLSELTYLAKRQGANEITAVATSALRTAKNGEDVAAFLSQSLEIKVRVISQTDEAIFGYNSAFSTYSKKHNVQKDDVVVWDIGGGSMQIVTSEPKTRKIYLGKLASVNFKNKILKLKQKNAKSPNPMGQKLAIDSMNIARKYSNTHAKPLLKSLKDKVILGVGGVHYYSIRKQINEFKYSYGQNQLLETLLERAQYSDQQIGGKYAQTDVTNISLVLGFMQSLGIEKVIPLNINMAHGLLITESYWK